MHPFEGGLPVSLSLHHTPHEFSEFDLLIVCCLVQIKSVAVSWALTCGLGYRSTLSVHHTSHDFSESDLLIVWWWAQINALQIC